MTCILEPHSLDSDRLVAPPDAFPRHGLDPVGQTGSHRGLATVGKSERPGTGARVAAGDEDQTRGDGDQACRRKPNHEAFHYSTKARLRFE